MKKGLEFEWKMSRLDVVFFSPYKLKKAYSGDACYDIHSNEDKIIEKGTSLVSTSLYLNISDGWYGQLLSRSGLASKGITVEGGVIDSSYRGEIKVILKNSSDQEYPIKKGDKIAQIAFLPVPDVNLIEVNNKDDLSSNSSRGEKGFGSSG